MPDRPAANALRIGSFRTFLVGRTLGVLGRNVFVVALGWDTWQRTRSKYAIGLLGLAQVLPVVLLALPAGSVADRADRRRVAAASQALMAACAVGFAALSAAAAHWALRYALLVPYGCAVAFNQPAVAAIVPRLVPPELRENASAWSSAGFEVASIGGLTLAGALLAATRAATVAYAVHAVTAVAFALSLLRVPPLPPTATRAPPAAGAAVREALAGLRFVARSRLLLPAITLDLFAVLFGGVTALLPVFADEVFHVGPSALGWLYAAPALGALVAAVAVTRRAPFARPGAVLLAVVTGFGLCTLGFALARSLPLALAFLFLAGACDSVSVVIRGTLEQMVVPDAMRGRVSAVHYVFIGMSNQLGELESGVAAALLGTVPSVVAGALATLAVAAWIAWRSPALRALGPLGALRPEEP